MSGEQTEWSDLHTSVLGYHEPELVKRMNVMVTLGKLVARGVLSDEDEVQVLGLPSLEDRARCLLDLLKSKGSSVFDVFVSVLEETGQIEFANSLRQDSLQGGPLQTPVQPEEQEDKSSGRQEPMECDELSTGTFSFEMKVPPDDDDGEDLAKPTNEGGAAAEDQTQVQDENQLPLPCEETSPGAPCDSTSDPLEGHRAPATCEVTGEQSDSCVKPDLPIISLPTKPWDELVKALSIVRDNGKDWRVLAHHLNYSKQDVALLKQSSDKHQAAESVLKDWEVQSEATVGKLCEILRDNNMGQIAGLLLPQ